MPSSSVLKSPTGRLKRLKSRESRWMKRVWGSPFGNIEVRVARENNLMSYTWGGLCSRECRTLDSHPFEHADPPAHGAVGIPPGQQQAHQGTASGGRGSLLGADRLKSAGTVQCQPRENDVLSPLNGAQLNHERSHQTFNPSLDSHRL